MPSAIAGPALIVAAVLVVLHRFVFAGTLSSQHPDILGYWLPTFCHLGRALRAGHVPAWNPSAMGGVPFAADPQSGWMYAPAMVLFSAFRCDLAMRWMVVLQPVLAGLGLYWFLRAERLSRPAATVGGLAFAVGLAGSRLGQFLPFPSGLAWTALMLAACARYVRARTWPGRLGWCVLTALSWGQLAAAYFAHLLVLGTLALVMYLAARGWSDVRTGVRSRQAVLRGAGLLVLALPLVNLAYLLPRLAYLPRTSFTLGSAQLAQGAGVATAWPLILATAPGFFLGSSALLVSFAGWRATEHRPLFVAFGGFALLAYLAGDRWVAEHLGSLVRNVPVLRFYTHYPSRYSIGVLLALPVLAALGVEAWGRATNAGTWILVLAPALAVWFLLPPLAGAPAGILVIPWIGGAVAAVLLAASAGRPRLLPVIPALLAVELAVSGVAGQTPARLHLSGALGFDTFGARSTGWFIPLAKPDVDAGAYDRPDAIVQLLRRDPGRFVSFDPQVVSHRGYLTLQGPGYWGLLSNQRGMLFGLQDAQGYNPVQLERYWRLVRAAAPFRIDYTAAVFPAPGPVVLDLLQVSGIVAPSGRPPVAGARLEDAEGSWSLYRVATPAPRAQLFAAWRRVDPGAALSILISGRFDPRHELVLEPDSSGASPADLTPAPPGTATYRETSDQSARVVAVAPGGGVMLIRTPFDPGWHATVDGRPARLLHADYLNQAVVLPPGRHTIILSYDDPWIGYGVLGSALVLIAFAAWAVALRRRPLPGPPVGSGEAPAPAAT